MPLADLLQTPEPVLAAGAITRRFDGALARGFARVTDQTRDDLGALARTFTGTPLGAALEDAITGLDSGVQVQHLRTFAEARVALEGARYDALMAQAASALGLALAANPAEGASGGQPLEAAPLLESVQHWLLEVALAGFMQLERATVAPFIAVLENLQEDPAHRRLAALLTGFTTELLDHTPTASLDHIPARRWADLWTRAMLLASRAPQASAETQVEGTFTPVGVDVHLHDNLASAQVWGVLERGGARQVARATCSTWKVDVVAGNEIWSLLASSDGGLLGLVNDDKAAQVKGMSLGAAGDLAWHPDDVKGQSAHKGLLAAAAQLKDAALPRALPLDRHPAHLAIPVLIQGAKLKKDGDAASLTADGATLPLALERVGALGPDEKAILKTSALVALLRFDAERWVLQPLTVEGKDGAAPGLAAGIKLKNGVANILKERASKLLRRK